MITLKYTSANITFLLEAFYYLHITLRIQSNLLSKPTRSFTISHFSLNSPMVPVATSSQRPVPQTSSLISTPRPLHMMLFMPGTFLFGTLSSLRSSHKFHLLKAAFHDHSFQKPSRFPLLLPSLSFLIVLNTTYRSFAWLSTYSSNMSGTPQDTQ